MPKFRPRSAVGIALFYAFVAGIFVFLTHEGLERRWMAMLSYWHFETLEGIALAGLASLMLFLGLRYELSARDRNVEALRQNQNDLELRVRQRTDALDVERRLLKAVVENAPASIALFDGAELRVKWTNRQYHEALPQPLRDIDIAGLHLTDLFPDASSNGMVDLFVRVANTRQPYHDPELAYDVPGRETTYWQWSLVPLPGDTQAVADLMLLAHDTTDQVLPRKRLEEMQVEAECRAEELRQTQIDLEARARELAALLDISRDLTTTLLSRPLLELILDHLKTMIDYTGAMVVTAQDDGIVVVAYRGPLPKEETIGARVAMDQAPGFLEVLRCREPVIIDDLQSEAPLAQQITKTAGQEVLRSLGTSRAWLGVPLVLKDRVIGLLRLDHSTPGYFTQHHAQLALAIANQAAVALENARLYEEAGKVASLEERQRLALELHDSVSQALYGIALGTHAAREQLDRAPEKLQGTLDYILGLSETAVAQVRALVFELRPDSIEQVPLVAALPRLAETLHMRNGVTVRLDLCEEPTLSLAAKEALYRVAQESLRNAIKHASAKVIELRLRAKDECVVLEVQDDGIGFDPTLPYPGHFGLQSMRERVHQLGGKLEIDSAPARGTRVRVQMTPSPSL